MRSAFQVLLLLILWSSAGAQGLSKQICLHLDSTYAEWKFSTITGELAEAFFSGDTTAGSFVSGDFNDDQVDDCGVQITYQNRGSSYRSTIVFLSNIPFVIDTIPEDKEYYLVLRRKGSLGYDFEADKQFTFPIDAVEIGYAGKAGTSYIFRNNSFQRVTTAD